MDGLHHSDSRWRTDDELHYVVCLHGEPMIALMEAAQIGRKALAKWRHDSEMEHLDLAIEKLWTAFRRPDQRQEHPITRPANPSDSEPTRPLPEP